MSFEVPRVTYVLGPEGHEVQHGTGSAGRQSGEKSGENSGSGFKSSALPSDFPHDAHTRLVKGGHPVGRVDPHRLARDFPRRWQAFVTLNYPNEREVMRVFAVDYRTARNWFAGKTGVNGRHTAVAMADKPATAFQMLYAAE